MAHNLLLDGQLIALRLIMWYSVGHKVLFDRYCTYIVIETLHVENIYFSGPNENLLMVKFPDLRCSRTCM